MAACFIHLGIVCLLNLALSSAAKPNCTETQCKALPVGENVASEFQLMATEKGVRMVYLNLVMGNDTYNPLELRNEFLPKRWVWAQSISEPMLSLPYDYDILSLGLLNCQVRSMTIQMKDQPSGCLAEMNSTCQNLVVGRALLDNVTRSSSSELSQKKDVVCVAVIEKADVGSGKTSIKNHCCSPNAPLIQCELTVKSGNWFAAIKTFFTILSAVALFYCPMLHLALPDCISNLRYERNKEDRTQDQLTNSGQGELNANHTRNGNKRIIDPSDGEHRLTRAEVPVDDASSITCSTLLLRLVQGLPAIDVRLSFNVKLAFIVYCLLPFVFYVQAGLYLTLKQKYIQELLVKLPPGTLTLDEYGPLGFLVVYANVISPGAIFMLILLALASLKTVLFLRPKDLFLHQDTFCPVCAAAMHVSVFPATENLDSNVHIGDKMLLHMKILQNAVYSLMFFFLKQYLGKVKKLLDLSNGFLLKLKHDVSRMRRALCVLWVLFSILPALLVSLVIGATSLLLFSITLVLTLIFCSPFVTVVLILIVKISQGLYVRLSMRKCLYWSVALVTGLYITILFFCFYVPVSIFCSFIVGMLGFTIMGLVLNAEIVIPYAAFFLVVATNIYLCYANLQSRYMEVKAFILEYWQKELQITDSDQGTIPTDLFWYVCERGFPIQTEICLMFRNMAVIVSFLFLAVSSIIFFGNTYNISTVVSTIAVFVSGVIPSLFFKSLTKAENFSGWAKIKIKREIETAVKEFNRERGNDNVIVNNGSASGESSVNEIV